jgi:hypothetical protein
MCFALISVAPPGLKYIPICGSAVETAGYFQMFLRNKARGGFHQEKPKRASGMQAGLVSSGANEIYSPR